MRPVTTPQSILIGFVIAGLTIGGFLYLALRPAAVVSGAQASSSAPRLVPELSKPLQAQADADQPDRELIRRQTQQALEQHRVALVRDCWTPLDGKQQEPGRAAFVWNFTFNAQGQQIARGLIEDRDASVRGLGMCISQKLASISIPPAGVPTYVEVPFVLP